MSMRFLIGLFAAQCAISAAHADVFELGDDGRTVNITTRVFTLQSPQQAPAMPVQSNSVPRMVYVPTLVAQVAERHALNPLLLDAVIRQESGYRINARSSAGAVGLMQLMPGTAQAMGVDADDPAQNVEGGARYLRQQLDRFGGSLPHALAAYNAGPGAVVKHGGIPPYRETQIYVNTILGRLAVPIAASINQAEKK